MIRQATRREFLGSVAAGSAGVWLGTACRAAESRSPHEKLNIGIIGTANRAAANIDGVSSQNIVALCDVDDRYLGKAAERFPRARKYNDFRKLIDQNNIDAVVVSTPDHIHAVATVRAMHAGKHAYCEKPLAHSVWEARRVAETAAREGRATQLGTQIHAGRNYRRVVELVQSGAIGSVRECHVWCGKTWSGGDRPTETPPVPDYLHFDLWLGPAPERPYHPAYLPKNWRRWWDFGNGTLGDMGCHYMDLPHWALGLRAPERIAAEGPPVHPETTPGGLIVRYHYPERPEQPAVDLTWYDGGKRPAYFADGKLPAWGDGVLFVGSQGMLLADYNKHRLLPESAFADFKPPEPFIPDSIGHYNEWIEACKSGSPTSCNFDDSGALTEAVLLGNVAYRTGSRLEWDANELRATNAPDADRFIHPPYRKGWAIFV